MTFIRRLVLCLFCLTLAGCGLNETLHRSDKPVSREAAKKDISLPLPGSTRDIYYVLHSAGMHELEFFTRFTVDPKDMSLTASNLLADRDTKMQAFSSYYTNTLAEAPRSPEFTNLAPMTWWTPASITNGYYVSTTNGQPFHLWVDVGQHTFYLCVHD